MKLIARLGRFLRGRRRSDRVVVLLFGSFLLAVARDVPLLVRGGGGGSGRGRGIGLGLGLGSVLGLGPE